MKTSVSITDAETLCSVTPEELEAYLIAKEWKEIDRDAFNSFWEKALGIVEVEFHQRSLNYSFWVGRALGTIAEVEGHNNQRKVYFDIKHIANSFDMIADTPDGQIKFTMTGEWSPETSETAQELFMFLLDSNKKIWNALAMAMAIENGDGINAE